MSKARPNSLFMAEGRQRLGVSPTTPIPNRSVLSGSDVKNKRTLAEWDKDDGNYFNYANPNSADTEWLTEIGAINSPFNPNSGGSRAHAKFSEDMLTAIYNYSFGSNRFNKPLRKGVPFEGSNGENELKWFIPRYLLKDPESYNQTMLDGVNVTFTSKEAKKLEKALSRAYKYETDRGIVVARGGSASSGLPKVGDLTVTKGYTSTAYNGQDWGITASTPVRYIIRIPKGSRILHVSGKYRDRVHMDAWNGMEHEILLRKNSVFRTTAVETKPNGQVYIYQDYLGFGSKNKFKNRFLKGTPDHSIYTPVKM